MNIASWVRTQLFSLHREHYRSCAILEIANHEDSDLPLEHAPIYDPEKLKTTRAHHLLPFPSSKRTKAFCNMDLLLRQESSIEIWKSMIRVHKDSCLSKQNLFYALVKAEQEPEFNDIDAYVVLLEHLENSDTHPTNIQKLTKKERLQLADQLESCVKELTVILNKLGSSITLSDIQGHHLNELPNKISEVAWEAQFENTNPPQDRFLNAILEAEKIPYHRWKLLEIEQTLNDSNGEELITSKLAPYLSKLSENLRQQPDLTPRPSNPNNDRNIFAWELHNEFLRCYKRPLHKINTLVTSTIFNDTTMDQEKLKAILKEIGKRA